MNNQLNYNKKFKTKDFGIATILTTLGFSLEALDRGNPAKVIFIFRKGRH